MGKKTGRSYQHPLFTMHSVKDSSKEITFRLIWALNRRTTPLVQPIGSRNSLTLRRLFSSDAVPPASPTPPPASSSAVANAGAAAPAGAAQASAQPPPPPPPPKDPAAEQEAQLRTDLAKNKHWYYENHESLLETYNHKWIAIAKQKVAASNADFKGLQPFLATLPKSTFVVLVGEENTPVPTAPAS